MHNFTPEDLLEFFYQEMPKDKALELQSALENDWVLKQKLSVIEEAARRLDKSFYSPRNETVEQIMAYAASKQQVAL